MSDLIYPVYHKTSGLLSTACNEIGMYTTVEDPQFGDVLLAKDFFRLDKTGFEVNDETICGACGQPMPISINDIDYKNPVKVEENGS